MTIRSKNKRFQTSRRGKHPNSLANLHNGKQGRRKGSKNHNGLNAVLTMIGELVSQHDNLEQLRAAMQREMNMHPLGFYYKYIMPMLPKNIDITSGGEDIIVQISKQFKPKIPKRKSE